MALDVYGLTRHRNFSTIRRFLDEYADLPTSEDRGDEELAIEPLDSVHGETEWEPSHTLTHIIERGLSYPRRAFTVYITSRHVNVEQAILCFTRDDQIVLGLSLYNDTYPDDEALSKALLSHVTVTYRCHLGLILPEMPPPMSEAEFRQHASVAAFATFSYQSQ